VLTFFWWILCCHGCQYQAALRTAVSYWPSPPAALQLAPSNRSYLPRCTGCLTFLLWCYSFLMEFTSRSTFPVHGPSQVDFGLYTAGLPSVILFISPNKYVNTGTVMCCLSSCFSFIKKSGILSSFTANLFKGSWFCPRGLYRRSLWTVLMVTSSPNHSAVLKKTLFSSLTEDMYMNNPAHRELL